ncbi:quercetin 2,3-dioxygenase [Colletotrichum spaethianum]|uniref:Quercetin 2,3-dioxygenase n=1 Tax=Colletotrichum spaethianum TaxID=700344 RepID=A0AA37LCT0_9PEZI|nr:quercetin 2,3-dioxygenase [Colletotrichum spaethianum]GKT46127.1 quercetin 2,3-dioxygenase [Colletotrichum spaethianum]
MSIPVLSAPPNARTSYIIDQLEGERISIPGSKGTFRILASSKQTNGGIAVFSSGAVLSDAPGFHWHAEAHDIFLVTKGYLKLWNGDKCRIMGPGDFAYVPPLLGPHSETLGLVAPGDWVDFFRYVGEQYNGLIVPEHDDQHSDPKIMAAKDRFDVNFERNYTPPELADWQESENVLPGPLEPYFLRANTGPRYILGGVLSRPFINASQCSGKFSITSLESSKLYAKSPLARWLTFSTVDHCFCVQEGLLKVKLKESGTWTEVREGQTLLVSAGQAFTLDYGSRFMRAITFTNGPGIEALIQDAGQSYSGFVLPEEAVPWSEEEFKQATEALDVIAEDF